MKNYKVFITGAAGFVGKHLTLHLLNRGYSVCVFIKKGHDRSFFTKLGVRDIYEGDLEYGCPELKEAFHQHNFDAVVHLAALIKATWPEFQKVNVDGTKYLIELAEAQEVSPRFVFTSTDFVLFDAGNEYKESKRLGEELLRKTKLPYTILRPSPIYGPGDTKNLASLIGLIKKFPVLPAPSFTMYPIYVGDLVDGIEKVLRSGNVARKEYNLPGGSVMTFYQMMAIIKKISKSRCILVPVPNRLFMMLAKLQEIFLPNPVLNYYQVQKWALNKPISAQEAKGAFGFVQTPFEEGIKTTIKR